MTDFIAHLERCSAEVATWPEWKRNVLRTKPYTFEIRMTEETPMYFEVVDWSRMPPRTLARTTSWVANEAAIRLLRGTFAAKIEKDNTSV